MALPLYIAAAVMTVGGLLAIYFGSDIIVLERGWSMVIAGSVFAGCGAVLAGIAMAVARLQAIEGALTRVPELSRQAGTPSFMDAVEAALASPPVGGAGTPAEAARGLAGHRDLEVTPEPVLTSPGPEPAAGPLPAGTPEPTEAAREPEPEPDLFAPEGEAAAETRASPPADEPQPPSDEPQPPADEPQPPTVVGTYNSGGNFYIMYSDGSIEAETPAGKFRFDSLDELKDFIARGGDKAKAGASA